ncbi:MAG: phage tail protein [Candidatus Nephthysia bennettiae]|jgi:uncharacterized protein involved in type VI secretion and phage assembly|uniref:Phage tail protein n=1 Tax=Candidatus Nephthysia bennettiae TaxID=3127016 RepID=A0A934NBZ2_9BACT|nr:phage tail protein [Candidatus Dormibacteraeota bacterium]MBJ7612131.1 phage tail protein [Candidatus Dormibacteraeota bacterium]PZS00322.1 MAG: phage tail protein [Candidatus Dormibacteraeota bacterium]
MSQELDLRGLLEGRVKTLENEVEGTRQRVYGVTLGTVTSLLDPKGLGRVKVKFPWLSSQVDSAWARIATAWAGGSRGTYLLPEVDDEVLVAFSHGDLKHPYIIGFLWNDTNRPPEFSPLLERRELKSKSGHRVIFDDFTGLQGLTLESQGGHKIKLDDTIGGMQISVTDSSHNLSLVIDSTQGTISITSKVGRIELNAAAGQISLNATSVDVHATGALSLKGDGAVTINGATVRIN